jgi:glycosyltransferase involved in cell wall biosynthesis
MISYTQVFEDSFNYKNKMANLLVITNWYPQLWTNRYINNFVKEFTDLVSDQFDEIYVISPQPYFPKFLRKFKFFEKFYRYSNFENYNYGNIKVFYPSYLTLPIRYFRNKQNYTNSFKKIIKVILKNNLNFDIVHCHFIDNWIIGNRLKEMYKNKKIILHCHDSPSPIKNNNKNIEKYINIFKWVDACISFCEQYEIINKFFKSNKIDIKNIYIPNFVDTKKFYPKYNINHLRESYWFKPTDKILICIWNIVLSHKWQNDILDIYNDLSKSIKNLHLILIWDWPDKEKMLKTIDNLNSNNIHYLWPKNNEEISDYLNISNLFLFPSRHESFWIVQIESIACWTPVIEYKNWWSEYIIKDNRIWCILNNQDTNLLKEWILRMLNTEYDREYLHQYIVDKYSWEIIKEKLIDLYFNY